MFIYSLNLRIKADFNYTKIHLTTIGGGTMPLRELKGYLIKILLRLHPP